MIFSREIKEEWNLWNKIGFRFIYIYLSFYIFNIIASGLFKPLVHWVGVNIFTITYEFTSNGKGSGDTTYQYILLFIVLCTAIIGTIIWSIFDKRKSYNQLSYVLSLQLRFVLIPFLFIYGFIKVFHLQMPPPEYNRLMEPIGQMSPMGLAWTFMGYSKAYSMFAGGAEVLAGILLVSRRLQTIGSILVIAVIGNVFIMNMAFDIPVKIFSFHLMLMGIVLFLNNSKRFVNAVVLGKSIPKEVPYPTHTKEAQGIIRIVKASVTILLVGIFLSMGFGRVKKFEKTSNPLLKGVWEVTIFKKNNIELLPLTTDKDRWKYFIISYEGRATVKAMTDENKGYAIEVDTLSNELRIGETKEEMYDTLSFVRNENQLEFSGLFEQDSIFVQMKRKDDKDFILTSRGFNWINERPNNQ